MKRSGKRLLALLLCLAMALTLLPMSVLAARDDAELPATPAEAETTASKAELPVTATEGDESASLADGTSTAPDGATADTWVQIVGSKVSGSVDPRVEDGKIVLSAAAANGNNINGDNPAIFVDTDMNKALSALADDTERTLSFTLTPSGSGAWMGFALLLRYDGTTGASIHTYQIGYPSGETTGWFTENFGAGDAYGYPGFTGPDMTADQPVDFEITWTESAGISSFKIGGQSITLSAEKGLTTVPALSGDNTDGLKGVGFKVATKNGSATTLRLSNVHYTGQQSITSYTVSGTVTDGANPLADVTVSAGNGKTATTDAQGAYSLELADGTYTLTATKTGYDDATKSVTVNGANLTGQNMTMTAKTVFTLPTDGVTDDTWARDTAADSTAGKTSVPGSICEQTANGVHLKSSTADGNGHEAASAERKTWPGVFLNQTANTALAAVDGDRFVEVTFVRAAGSNPRFGLILNYESPTSGFFVGCNTESSGWFLEGYKPDGTSNWQGLPSGGTTPAVGVETTLRIEWNQTKLIGVWQNGEKIINEYTFLNTYTGKGVGFRMNNYRTDGVDTTSEFYIKEMHYSGQTTVTAYPVSGTVSDANGALAGVTVSAGEGYTTTTDANGAYRLILPENKAYTLTATKDGYSTATETVATLTAAVTKDITLTKLPVVSGTVTEEATGNAAIPGATVTLTSGTGANAVTKTATTDQNGSYSISVPNGTYTITVSAAGYASKTEENVAVSADTTKNFTLVESLDAYHVLESTGMRVLVSKTFPQVVEYRLTGGQRMDGQKEELSTIKINGTVATLGTITSALSADKKTVTYTIPMTAPVAATMTARLTVDTSKDDMKLNDPSSDSAGRTLGFFIDKVEYTNNDRLTNPVKNIEIPNHFLVSVNSTQAGAQMTGAKMGNNSVTTNDITYLAELNKTLNWSGTFFAAFISNNSLAASITSNSSLNGNIAGSGTAPNEIRFVSDGTNCTIGLSSISWPYDYLLSDSNPGGEDHTANLTAEQKVVQEDLRETPFAKVVIAPEQNNDGTVNWQDGAIALRETVMHVPANSALVRDQVSTRIALNFGSQAQNPFLTSLDNAKRVAAHTDGLGQMIVLKGYANEGHDSGHPDYWDMGTRMGGATDFATMLAEGKKIGAYFGIHTNASEMYAEAKAVSEELIRYRGMNNTIVNWGWHWHDTAIKLRALYDLGTGNRAERYRRLAKEGGGELALIYVDVWGNGTGGTEDSWQTRMLSNEITQMENKGWRIAHEWASANPYDSTWQHWVTDFTYGNYGYKGELNSAVLRFLLNQYKDSFPADFASYGGACNAPLLGGPAMQGFEGWQGDGEYDLSIYNIFNQMIPTKFLQHYEITNWTNATAAVKMPYNGGGAGASRNNSTLKDWTPEVQIKLSDGTNNVVVNRGTSLTGESIDLSSMNTLNGFLAGETEYRSRVMTLNNKVILKGAPASAGEDNTFPASKATLEYLIPWYWNNDGTPVDADNEKLYYWNGNQNATSSSQWDLPDGWGNLSTVILYELSDQGRGPAVTVNVSGGKVTFNNIKANTGYVVTKGAANAAAPTISYTAPGQHLTDPSFNDAHLAAWTKAGAGTAEKVNSVKGISVLKLTGAVSVSQVMTEIKPNTKYAVYAAVENKGDAKAYMKVTDAEGNELAYNYTTRSIADNYISGDSLNRNHGIEVDGSKIQNMYVFFTAPASGDVTITLGREAGDGNIYFDAVRVVETQMAGYIYDENGKINGLTQDFEHSAQGEWPFVVSGVEGVQDNRQHLSEKNAPYTQSGWNIKEVDDVISGNWSLKTHGIAGGQSLVYQTIPQNFRFEPGKTYTVSFDYQMGCENLMQVVIGDGAWNGINSCQTIPLEMAKGTGFEGYPSAGIAAGTGTKTCTFTVVGSESGQTWIGIATAGGSFNNTGIPDTDEYALYFSGRGDFILDNLSITVSPVDKSELNKLAAEAAGMAEASYNEKITGAWAAFVAARTAADAVLENVEATQAQVDDALVALENAIADLEKVVVVISGTVTCGDNAVAGAVVTLENTSYRPVGLTATTDAEGKFSFTSTNEITLAVTSYKLKVQSAGYLVNTFNAVAITKTNPTSETACELVAESTEGIIYSNNFDNGDVSMMGALTTGDDIPTWEAVDYNGSKALKVTFNANSGETRGINNVVDKTVQVKNGTVSFDVTGLTNTLRLGVTLRATGPNDRIFVGQEDNYAKWFWEWWNGSNSSYEDPTVKDIGVYPGETRRVRVELNEQNVQVFVDGVQIYNSTMTGAPDTAGWVGINMRNNAGTSYILDNLRIVSKDAAPEGSHTISGKVLEGTTPVAGATVTLLNASGTRLTSITTNANGEFKTSPTTETSVKIKVTAAGYVDSQEESIELNADVTNKEITLVADKTALNTLYDAHKDKAQGSYTNSSWAVFQTALTAAETVKNKEGATKAEIDKAIADLTAAVEGLAVPGDKTELDAAITTAEGKTETDYTPKSWAPLAEALAAAKVVKADENASQSEIDAATAVLNSALEGLKERADTAALQAAYDEQKEVKNEGYTSASWTAFQNALKKAEDLLANPNATQAQVDAAIEEMAAAKEALTKQPSGGGSSSSSGSTTTETREDGSKVTTVTKPDGTVTETVEQPDGSKSETVTAKDGAVTITVTDKDGEELAKVELPATIPAPETRFDDVPEGHWADKAIHNAAALELVKGVGNNKFDMVAPMSRGSLATVLHRLSQGKTDYEVTFQDVAEGKYYTEGVAWAAKAGVVTGYTADIFAPEDVITREQLAVMLARYAKLIGMDTKADAKALDQFADGENTGSWAVNGVAWCVANGILQGKGGNVLDPTTNVTRAEVAVMLDRFIALIQK